MAHHELKKNRSYGPSVRLIHQGPLSVVEKTYRERGAAVRLLGLALISWEKFIYSKLTGIEGIPELMPGTDRLTLVTRFMGGTNLKETDRVPELAYFEALKSLIARMHARGVIHLDLRNRRNYGIDDAGNPYLVDFATCLYLPWGGRIKRLLEAIDWMGFVKVKHKIRPQLLDGQEKALLNLGMSLSSLWIPTKIVRGIRECAKFLKSMG